MKRQIIIILLFCILCNNLIGQKFEWAKQIGGIGTDNVYSLKTDKKGNLFLTGLFSKTADFDPGPGTFNMTSAGDQDIYVTNLDDGGNLLWAKRMGGTGNDVGHSVNIDNSGNIYVVGQFEETADFDPGPGDYNLTAKGQYDGYILKLDPFGNFLWVRQIGGQILYSATQSIDIDSSGYVYTTTRFSGTVEIKIDTGNISINSVGNDDILTIKLDSKGNFIWAKQMGGVLNDYPFYITIDLNGNIYTTGLFGGIVDFDPGPNKFNLTASGNEDIFLSKLSSLGEFEWAINVGGDGNFFDELGNSIAIDPYGDIYLTGQFTGKGDFDPGPGTYNLIATGGNDAFILKLDNLGNFVWAKRMGGTFSGGHDIVVDATGSVYTTGRFQGTGDFNPGTGTYNLTSTGMDDIFILKLDASGNFIWAKQMGGIAGNDRGNSIDVDANGNLYTTGFFYIKADLDPGSNLYFLTAAGSYEVFIVKMSQCENTKIDIRTACDSLKWIDGKTYKSSNNTAKYKLSNVKGCDSLVTLNLKIYKSYLNTISQTVCDSFVLNGINYSTSGHYIVKSQSQQGCDSTTTLDLSIQKSSISTERITACDHYYWYGETYYNSGTVSFEVKTNAGCDSITRLELIIKKSNAIDIQYETCDSYAWNGQIYTQSGKYKYDTINRFGCDSSITLNLIVNKNTKTTIIDTACQPFTFNDIQYSESGKYYQTIKNVNNCDSLIELDLTFIKLDNGILKTGNTLSALEKNSNYQWLDCNDNYTVIPGATQQNYLPNKDGSYAVILSTTSCVDTSACIPIVFTNTISFKSSNLKVYPNPASLKIYLEASNQNLAENLIIIKDVHGRTILKKLIPINYKSPLELDINSYPIGIYYLSIITPVEINTISFSKM
ncbi:MAG: SBBP repeat-containing protein [Saprospiraceae bacterium]